MGRTLSSRLEMSLLSCLYRAGLNGKTAQKIVTSPGNKLARDFIALAKPEKQLMPDDYVKESISIDVDSAIPLQQLFKQGKFDDNYLSRDASFADYTDERCEKYRTTIDFMGLGKLSPNPARRLLQDLGYRWVSIRELLIVGAKHPELQLLRPILSLSPRSDGKLLYLTRWDARRVVREKHGYVPIPDHYWIAAVKE